MADSARSSTFLRKLMIGLFGAIVIVVVATHLLLQLSVTRFSVDAVRAELAREARVVRHTLRGFPERPPRAEIAQLAELLDARITIVGADGHIIIDSHIPDDELEDMPLLDNAPEVLDAREHGSGFARRASAHFGDELIYVAIPLGPAGDAPSPDSKRILRLSVWASALDTTAEHMRETLYWLASGTVVGALVFSFLLAGWLTRPLRAFARTTRAVARGEKSRETLHEVAVAGELSDLAEALLALTRQLDAARARVKADSPHLAVLLEALEMPVLFVNPAGQIVRTNEAARAQLDFLYTMRDLQEAGLGQLQESVEASFAGDGPVCTTAHLDEDLEGHDHDWAHTHWRATVFPMSTPDGVDGAVIILEPLEPNDVPVDLVEEDAA